jgi:hypothetical protein
VDGQGSRFDRFASCLACHGDLAEAVRRNRTRERTWPIRMHVRVLAEVLEHDRIRLGRGSKWQAQSESVHVGWRPRARWPGSSGVQQANLLPCAIRRPRCRPGSRPELRVGLTLPMPLSNARPSRFCLRLRRRRSQPQVSAQSRAPGPWRRGKSPACLWLLPLSSAGPLWRQRRAGWLRQWPWLAWAYRERQAAGGGGRRRRSDGPGLRPSCARARA